MKTLKKTKIICTLGPASDRPEIIKSMLEAGMNVARFNFSHGTHEEHRRRMETLRQVCVETGIPAGVLLDTKGPEIRTGIVADNGKIILRAGEQVTLTVDGSPCVPGRISLSYKPLPKEICAGKHIFIADGLIDLQVTEIRGSEILARVVSGGEVGSKKNVNVPGVRTSLPALADQDYADILFGLRMNIDFIAASFIRKAADIVEALKLVEKEAIRPRIIAKIEDEEGVENAEEILRFADGIMVARGDLGVQIPEERIPLVQKELIEKCNRANRIVVTATQMLESMTVNPKPTRAELTDVANAVFDGTDAVMLSGETAGGKYPVEAVRVMRGIIDAVEGSAEYNERSRRYFQTLSVSTDIPHATAKAAHVMAEEIGANAILCLTRTGNTARILSMYRPVQTIVAAAPCEQVQKRLLLNWGIYPLVTAESVDSDDMIMRGLKALMKSGYAKKTDRVVVVAGVPVGTPLVTNMVRVYFLGNILCRGERGFGGEVTGRVVRAASAMEAAAKLMLTGDEILVTANLDEDFRPFMKSIAGYILEGYSLLSMETILEENPDCVAIASAPGALEILADNLEVTLNGEEKLVYEGII
ncbi:MAG: pyruvate kinase [Spirochaetales bacterium]|jgi:pyruvate kinase|nr:pyruvate kinase [Spirochaetales bacterium]